MSTLKKHRLKLNLVGSGGSRIYITSTYIEQRIGHNMKIHIPGDLLPVIVTVIVAVVGVAGILNNLHPANDSQGSTNSGMITAAAVSRAGAIEFPSEPRAGWR
jgi:hypothetical protein